MEGGGGAAQGQRQGEEAEEKAGAGRQPQAAEGAGGGMKFRVSARAPHGVGALLLIGGAVLAGAAVVAWRHARRRRRGGPQPAKQEALDGGVVEDGKGDAPAPEMDQPYDDVRQEKEKTMIGSNGLGNDGVTEEIQEVHDDIEIVANEPKNEFVEKIDLDSRSSPTEISMHDDVVDEDVKTSDQCSHSINRAGVILCEQRLHGDGAQEAESMENSPTAQLMMHQEQLLDDMTMHTEGEAAEAKPGKRTALDNDVQKQGQQKAMEGEPVGLAGSPPLSSLVNKPTEKKEPELPGRTEAGMKIEQDYANGGMKEHGPISKGGAVMTVDRRSFSMAILALMFALTIGICIVVVVRLYAPPRAAKLQMDLP